MGDDGGSATGLGLGLSIVERVARILGSDITLRTTPGKGSMFAITVPLSHVTIPRVRSKSLPRQRLGLGIAAAVLVIDDEPAILDGMKHLLSGWGCTAHVALGGAEAFRAYDIADGKIDMILADFHLDKEDGISLINELRRKARRPIPGHSYHSGQVASCRRPGHRPSHSRAAQARQARRPARRHVTS